MTVDDALKLARDCGVRVTLDGNDLALEAAAPPPPRLLAVIGRGKWDIVAVLRQREAEERRRIIQWVADNFTSSPADVCGKTTMSAPVVVVSEKLVEVRR